MTPIRRNMLWPLIIIAVGGIWLLMTAGAFPDSVGDLLLRGWPVLLVLFGLDVLAGRRRLRVSRWTVSLNVLGLVATLLLLSVVIWLAYAKQADVLRSDNVQTFSESLSDEIAQVRLEVAVQRTTITVNPAAGDDRTLRAEFKGSNESDVEIIWTVEGATGVLTVREESANSIPKLEDYGRGTLTVVLPAGIPIQHLELVGEKGDVTVDMLPLRVERIDIAIEEGDLTLSLPTQDVLAGTVKTESGNLELKIPDRMAMTLALQSGSGDPDYEYNTLRYDVLRDGTLRRRNADPFQIALDVWLRDGAALNVIDVEG